MTTASEPAAAAPAPRDPLVGGLIEHPSAYKLRRFLNWFPLGVAYAMLYMGRYNLNVAKQALGTLMTKEDFGHIFGTGTLIYGFAFLVNGPLTDRVEGRRAMIASLTGAFLANLAIGLYVRHVLLLADPASAPITSVVTALYALNMYFQSFGAVAIVKVNSAWFHVRERGSFSGIFGIMISSGIFFAFDVNQRVYNAMGGAKAAPADVVPVLFILPAALLFLILVVEFVLLRDHPSHAGHQDIETGAAHHDDDHRDVPTIEVLRRILTNPIIMTVAGIEFCTGVLRQSIMQWFPIYADEMAKAVKAAGGDGSAWLFTKDNWGLILFVAGVLGGVSAGLVSDKVFQSRRAPAAGLLYGLLLACTAAMVGSLGNPVVLCGLGFLLSLAVIGTHGLLSGTATMDFGGKKGTATAVGVIDGAVYLGTAVQAFSLGYLTSLEKPAVATAVAGGWRHWPVFMLPFGAIGLFLLIRIWHAIPKGKKAAH